MQAPRNISAVLFVHRFTPQEEAAIRAHAASNAPTALLVSVFLGRLFDPRLEQVDLDNPDTVAGLGLLRSLNLLTADRVAQIRA